MYRLLNYSKKTGEKTTFDFYYVKINQVSIRMSKRSYTVKIERVCACTAHYALRQLLQYTSRRARLRFLYSICISIYYKRARLDVYWRSSLKFNCVPPFWRPYRHFLLLFIWVIFVLNLWVWFISLIIQLILCVQ